MYIDENGNWVFDDRGEEWAAMDEEEAAAAQAAAEAEENNEASAEAGSGIEAAADDGLEAEIPTQEDIVEAHPEVLRAVETSSGESGDSVMMEEVLIPTSGDTYVVENREAREITEFDVEEFLKSRLPKISAGNIMIKSKGAEPIILIKPDIPARHLASAVEYIGLQAMNPEDVIAILTYRVLGSTYKAGFLFGHTCFIFRGLIGCPEGYGILRKGKNPDSRITINYCDLAGTEITFSENGRDKLMYGPELRLNIYGTPVTLYDSSAKALSNMFNDMKFRLIDHSDAGNADIETTELIETSGEIPEDIVQEE